MGVWVFPLKSINGSNMYGPDDFRQFYANIFSTGILATAKFSQATALQVTQTETPSLNVVLGPGCVIMEGGQLMNSDFLNFKIPAPLVSQSRTDSIVAQWNSSMNTGGFVYKENNTQVVRTKEIYELQICKIVVPASATYINQSNIKDMRSDESVCGFSTPFAELNVGDLMAQYEAQVQDWFDQAKVNTNNLIQNYDQQFQDWFQNLQDQLDENQAGNLQNQIDNLNGKVYTAYANSADGSEDFTPLYPNLNLEKHTAQLIGTDNNLIWGSFGNKTKTIAYENVSIPEVPSVKVGLRMTQVTAGQSGWRGPAGAEGGSYAVIPGEKYTISAYLKNNADTDVTINLQLGTSNVQTDQTANTIYVTERFVVPANSDFKLYSAVVTIPTGNVWAWSYVYTDTPTVTADYTIAGLKVETGENQTLWMPHASEVKPSDYPQYIYKGMFANLHNSDRNNPANYNWVRNTDVVRDEAGTVIVKNLKFTGDTNGLIPLTMASGFTANQAEYCIKNGWIFITVQGARPNATVTGQSYYTFLTLPSEITAHITHTEGFMWSNFQGGGVTYSGGILTNGQVQLYLSPSTNSIASNHRFSFNMVLPLRKA